MKESRELPPTTVEPMRVNRQLAPGISGKFLRSGVLRGMVMTGPNGIERIWSGRRRISLSLLNEEIFWVSRKWDVPLNAGPGDSI